MNDIKKFEDFLDRMKGLLDNAKRQGHIIIRVEDLENTFPELKENEDERIRKALIDYFRWNPDTQLLNEFTNREVFTWLEKQGEQKSTFNIGDWVMFNNKHQSIYQVEKIEDGYYILKHTHGGTFRVCILHDESLRLWTIQDAKDGDILVCREDKRPFIFKGLQDEYHPDNPVAYCGINCDNEFFISTGISLWTDKKVEPATKEQRDLLFQKIKEAGYEWDKNKKELRKIPNVFEECEIVHIEHGKYYYCIKDYYAGGNKRASKGDVVQALNGMSMMALGVKANEYFIPVNTIKQMSVWNEEDESYLNTTITYLKDAKEFKKTAENCINWLKSLRPQNTWKPSDEQMKELKTAIDSFTFETDYLQELYEDLKKLK